MNKINDTTYKEVAKDNPKDRIEVIVGDDKQEDFKPQVKIERWDNEVNFSIRAEEKEDAIVEEKDGVVKYKTSDYEVHMYDKPEAGEDGGFEFEWILPARPISNVLQATIQTKGLNFYYQPSLTPEEIEQGSSRPENVVGSYAVYHQSKRDNRVGGMEYKTGKAFHIYRPKIIDAEGNEIWGELNIDEENGLLTVTIDNDWIDKAIYPVVVDPTFGMTTAGASSSNLAFFSGNNFSVRSGHVVTPVESGNVTKLSAYIKQFSGSGDQTFNIFLNAVDSVGSNSHGQIASGEGTETLTTSATLVEVSASGAFTGGTVYVPNITGLYSGVGLTVHYDTRTAVANYSENFSDAVANTAYSNSKESPWTDTAGSSANINSIFVTYTGIEQVLDLDTYYWRVRAKDANGVWGDWSATRSFEITAGGGTVVKDLIGSGIIAFPR